MNQRFLPKFRHGLVFGKFMPLHEGHLHLLRFAAASCERLTVLVCSIPEEPIPGAVRYDWVKAALPGANVIHHTDLVPQEPIEHPNFWTIWRETVRHHTNNEPFDALFASEEYGWRMAQELGCEFVPVNRERTLVQTSGTAIRTNPFREWDALSPQARSYFVKRVRVVGPESAGKSTLTKQLAEHFHTSYADEYARRLLDEYIAHGLRVPGEVRYEDLSMIARGQLATEDAMAQRAKKVLFCDTDLWTTVYWSKFYHGRCSGWIAEEAAKRSYALTLLLSPDVPWVSDGQRPMPELEKRQAFFHWWKARLEANHEPYIVIEGSWDERWRTAVQAVEVLMDGGSPTAQKKVFAASTTLLVPLVQD